MTLADAVQEAKRRGLVLITGSDGQFWYRGHILPEGRMHYESFDPRAHVSMWREWPLKPPKRGGAEGYQIDWVPGDVAPPAEELRQPW